MSSEEHTYQVGDLVDRIEDRDVTGAKILSIHSSNGINEIFVELEYDEGGTGYWPVSAIKPKVI